MIKDNKLPILGLNTYQGSLGAQLPTYSIDFNKRSAVINNVLKKLSKPDGNIDTYKRSRAKVVFNVAKPADKYQNVFVLNEAFCAEKDVGSASRFRVSPDGTDWGIFKSSGIIISTGKSSQMWSNLI
jgi:NAD kinase